MSYFDDVKEFHRFFGHAIGRKPQFLKTERMDNRLKWQDEERQEFLDALQHMDIVEAADALADQVYFILGTAVEMGIPFDKVWKAVHDSNMEKANYWKHDVTCPCFVANEQSVKCDCGCVQYKEDGKTAKPDDWRSPEQRIREVLKDA